MNKKGFISQFLTIGVGAFANIIISVITTPIITRLVDPVDYGKVSLFLLYSSIAVIVLCGGLDQSLVRYYYEEENIEYKRNLLFRCIIIPLFLSIIFVILYFVGKSIFHFDLGFDLKIEILLAIFIIVQLMFRFSLMVIRLEQKGKLYSTLTVLNKILYISIALPFVYLIKSKYVDILVFAYLIAYSVCFFISVLAERDMWFFKEHSINTNSISNRELMSYGLPYVFSLGIMSFFQGIDKMSISYYCTYADVGIYASALQIVNVFAVVQTAFNTLWGPMAVKHFLDDSESTEFYIKGNAIITIIMFTIGFTLIFGKDIYVLLLGEKYREAARIVPFLVFSPIMYTISESTVSGLVFMKKSKVQVFISLIVCVSNLLGNILLVPRIGYLGAAISTGFTYVLFFTLRTFFSIKYYYIDFRLKKIYLLTLCLIGYAFYATFCNNIVFNVLIYIVCIASIIILYRKEVAYIFGYIEKYFGLRKKGNKVQYHD